MRYPSGLPCLPMPARLAAVGLAAALLGACSADTMRFADPFANPFSTSQRVDPAATGSVNAAAPTTSVDVAPLGAPIDMSALPPPAASPAPLAAPAPSGPARTPTGSASGWTTQGGTPIAIVEGDTLDRLAARYNVPSTAILSANGLASAADIRPGRTIVIPVLGGGGGQQVASVGQVIPASPPAMTLPAGNASSAAAPIPPRAPPRTAGTRPAQPSQQPAATPPRQQVASVAPTAPAPAPAPAAQAPAPQAQAPAAQQPTRTAALPDPRSNLDFRWPARGRVISGFGNAGNEGINIALPEGTPVRAAEGGVVAYAGDELRGYGKLILIRHADGYVSAYAHNSQLLVQRGEEVRRGQVIANSGRTGNVNAPQLHFEIRRGADPVDPMPYLTN